MWNLSKVLTKKQIIKKANFEKEKAEITWQKFTNGMKNKLSE